MKRGFILAYLALQLGLPASYYLTGREFDERFAWRMFSPTRVTVCAARFTTERDGEVLEVSSLQEVHPSWRELVERARPSVLEGFARWECERMAARGEAPVLRLELRCEMPDGSIRHPVEPERNLCAPR